MATSASATDKAAEPQVTTDLAVAIVLDKSGSMTGLTDAVIDGFNEYVDDLRGQEGETLFSLTLFDTAFKQPYIGVPLDKVERLTGDLYRAGGNTALYDAIAFTVKDLEQRLAAAARSDMKVLIVTMTDGQENSSTDYTAERLRALVREYEAKGNWTFVYVGFGQSAEYIDTQRGLAYTGNSAVVASASPGGVGSTMSSLSHATATRRDSAASASADFFGDAGQSAADYADPAEQAKSERPTVEKSSSSLIDALGGDH